MGIGGRQALECLRSDDLIGLGMEADGARRRLHPEGAATYVAELAVCLGGADWQARIAEAARAGATGVRLGCLPPDADLGGVEAGLDAARRDHPLLCLGGMPDGEIVLLARSAGLPVEEVVGRLHSAGLASIARDGIAQQGFKAGEWTGVHRAAHRVGMWSAVTMRFGAGETDAVRVDFLEGVRRLQDETGGIVALRPAAAPMPPSAEVTAVEYLKMLAVARMMLDEVPHIEADAATQGLKMLQTALRFGADDAGTVLSGSPARPVDTEEDTRRVIRGAGMRPVARDAAYRMCLLD